MENSTARGEKDVELFFDDDSTDADIDEEVAEYKSDGENEGGNEEEGEERERSSSFYSQQWPQSFRFSWSDLSFTLQVAIEAERPRSLLDLLLPLCLWQPVKIESSDGGVSW